MGTDSTGLALAIAIAVLLGAIAPVAGASATAAGASATAAGASATAAGAPETVAGAPATAAGTPAAGGAQPLPPAAYYGSLTVDGAPAPAGLTVTAEIDGEHRGSITTSDVGSYGGAGAFDPKLQVDGTAGDDGATVQFLVEGQPAGTGTWQSGAVRELALSATDVTLPPPSGPDDGDGADGGAGGGGLGGGLGPGTPPATPNSPGDPSVTVTTAGSSADVEVAGAQAGREVVVETNTDGDVGLESVSLTPLVNGSFTMNVSAFDSPPNGTPALPDGAAGVGFLQIDHSIADADVDGVTFQFRASEQRLTDRGLDPADVALYRLHGGQWTALPTSLLGQSAGSYAFEATSPGLSLFAVGQRPDEATSPDADGSDDPGTDEPTRDGVDPGAGTGALSTWTVVAAVLALAALAGGALVLRRRR